MAEGRAHLVAYQTVLRAHQRTFWAKKIKSVFDQDARGCRLDTHACILPVRPTKPNCWTVSLVASALARPFLNPQFAKDGSLTVLNSITEILTDLLKNNTEITEI